jgi:hypothetical protein
MKKLFYIAFIFLLSSCGFKTIVINNLDFAVSKKMGDILYLDNDQEDVMDDDVDELLNNFKPIAKDLITLANNIEIDHKQVAGYGKEVRHIYKDTVTLIYPVMIKHLITLNREQKEKVYKDLKKDIGDARRTVKKNKTDYLAKKFNFFFKKLTDKQVKIVENYKVHYYEYKKIRASEQEKFLNDLKKALGNDKLEINDKKKMLTQAHIDYFVEREDQKQQEKIYEMISKIVQVMTDEQKEHFRSKKDDVREFLEAFVKKEY